MRKLLATITTIAMVLSMSVPAFAVTIGSTEEGKNTDTKAVTANYAQSYDVTIAATENGSVTADPTTAKEGEEITLTITPDEGYELDTLTVTYGENQTVEVVDNKFNMPAADVTVTATFKEKQVVVTNATITGVTISGVDTNGAGAYVINPTSTVTFTVSGTDFDKLSDMNKVSVNGTEEALTAENGWTVDGNTAAKTYVGTTFADGLVLKYTNDGGDTWTTVDVTISYEIPEVVSVDINWGDMAFTYDGTAWAPDSEGGDKVTVTNNGNVTVGASVSYTPADSYGYITGSFDPDSAILDAEAEQVFTLTLDGVPTASLENVTIGNVTVTITEVAYTNVSSEAELLNAIDAGGNIKLTGDITMSDYKSLDQNMDITLNLNGQTLTAAGNGLIVYNGSLNVFGGDLTNNSSKVIHNKGGTVTVENCTLTGQANAFYHSGGTSTLKNCTVNGRITSDSTATGTIYLYAPMTFGNDLTGYYTGICAGGTTVFICDFDPNGSIANGTVTDNGNGTWTVTAAS